MDKQTYEKIIEALVARLGFIEWQFELEKEENAQLKKKISRLEQEKKDGV
jgi:hypothetical protein